jgi:hypothetical protein
VSEREGTNLKKHKTAANFYFLMQKKTSGEKKLKDNFFEVINFFPSKAIIHLLAPEQQQHKAPCS